MSAYKSGILCYCRVLPPPISGYLAPAGTLVVEGVEALTERLVLR